jgi:drug/metabolite transporter (DMT)-like permease
LPRSALLVLPNGSPRSISAVRRANLLPVGFCARALLLRKPLRPRLDAGIVAVFIGIALATRPDSVVEPETRLEQVG